MARHFITVPGRNRMRLACTVQYRRDVHFNRLQKTEVLAEVTCKGCLDTPAFEIAGYIVDQLTPTGIENVVHVVHDRLLLLEPSDHRTYEQIRSWKVDERAEVSAWAIRRHLSASDNAVEQVRSTPLVMINGPAHPPPAARPDEYAGTVFEGLNVCHCDEEASECRA